MNQRKQMKAKMNFEIEIFRTYGTLDMVVKIPVRHIRQLADDGKG
jgi:hypothetical protein